MSFITALQGSRLHIGFLVAAFLVACSVLLQSLHLLGHASSDPLRTSLRNTSRTPQRISAESNPRHRAVFYNIYVPSVEKKSRVIGIVREQLSEMKRSQLLDSAKLFYNVIGYNASNDIQQECGSQCHALKYMAEADEGLTLKAIYDYCQEQTGVDDALVTYIHDKGSLHPTPKNRHLRTLLTKGAFSDACQTIGTGENTCNVCGARFSPFPHHHVAGNMWTAQCSYIRKLHSPDDFADKMESLMGAVMQNAKYPNAPKPTFQQYQDEYFVGRGRFALEHWIGSHPSIRPCDVYPGEYLCGYIDIPPSTHDWIPDMQPAPRFPVSIFQKRSPRDGTWFCGQARLLEFQYLYGERPPEHSFLWSFYSESFRTCTEPLEFSKHESLYADFSTVMKSGLATL
jgi:hypothetical protein